MYKRLRDIQSEMHNLRENGFTRGYSIGWDFDKLPFTVKLGSTTYIGAAPASGKTELIKEIMINLSCLHGFNHVIFSPETGRANEIFAELCHSYIGKPYLKGEDSMSESERVSAEMFVDEHFIIIDPIDEEITITECYEMVDKIERECDITIHTTLIDPWNELKEEYLPEDLGREDKYLSRILGLARKNARAKNRHHFIVTHVRDQAPIRVDNITYFPPPHAREFAGGQVWFRKANTMVVPWRPPFGLSGDDNIAYQENELHFRIAKSKPKGVSKNGVYKLYLDTKKFQYYMIDPYTNNRIYADRKNGVENVVEEVQVPLTLNHHQNTDFDKPKEIEVKEEPNIEPNENDFF